MSSPASLALGTKKRAGQGTAAPTTPQPGAANNQALAKSQQQQQQHAAPAPMQSQMSPVASSASAAQDAAAAGPSTSDEKPQPLPTASSPPPALSSPSAASSSVSAHAPAASPTPPAITTATMSAAAIPMPASSATTATATSTASSSSSSAAPAAAPAHPVDSVPASSTSQVQIQPLHLSQSSRVSHASQSPAPMSARAARDEAFDSDGGGGCGGSSGGSSVQHRRALTTFQNSAPAAPDSWIDFPTQQRATSGGTSTGGGSGSGATSDPSSSAGSPTQSSLASGSSPPLLHGDLPPSASLYMQGMLTKKGRNLGFGLGFWRTTRLYMLTDTALSYTDKTKKEVKGNHLVEEFKSVTRMNSRRWPNRCLTLVFEDNKVWHLRAPTPTECTDWLDSLSKAIANAATRKARWRFVRDNAQMQQMQQMQQMGVQTQFGTVPLHVAQQQMDLAQMGMMQMPMPMPMTMPPLSPSAAGALMPPFQMHPMLAMQAQYAQMGMPVLPMHPAAYEASMQQQYADAMPIQLAADSTPMGVAHASRIKARSRTNLQAPSSSVAVGSATLLQRHDSRSRGVAGAVGSDASGLAVGSSPNELDVDGAMSSDDADVHTEDETDGEAEGVDEGEACSEGDFVSEMEDEAYDADMTPRFMPTAQTLAAYNPYTQQAAAFNAATYAQWTRAQAQQMADAALFNPAEQSSLNAAKDRLGWAMALLSMVGATILILGHEGRTSAQIFGIIVGMVGGGAAVSSDTSTALAPVSTSSSTATAVVAVSNATAVVSSNVTVGSASSSLPSWSLLSSLLSVRWSVLMLLLSLLSAVFFGLSLKKHKSRAKKQRQAEKAAKAAQKKEQELQRVNGTLNTAQLSAQQQQEWKAQSRILALELAQATRLMTGLGASAALSVATAAYMWRAA